MEATYLVVKCASLEHLKKCINSNTWACRARLNPPQPQEILEEAHEKGRVILIFSVNNQHGWHGICESRYQTTTESTEADVDENEIVSKEEQSSDDWHRFPVTWLKHFQDISTHACLPLEKTKNLMLVDGSSVNNARNWQQMSNEAGRQVCDLIHEHHEGLSEKKRLAEEMRQKPKQESFFKAEEDSIVSAEEIVGGWRTVIDKVERDLGRVILACPFGSQRYNCSLPGSDNDIFIVYQAKTTDILGLDPPKQTVKNSESEKIDYTVLEVQRYCELLISGDPKCIETLFIYEESILAVASEEWKKLRELGKALLTRTCVEKYLREAQGSRGIKQLEKMHSQTTDSRFPKMNKLGYIILRLLQSAQSIVQEKQLLVYRPADSVEQNELLNTRRGHLDFTSLMSLIKGYTEDIEHHLQNYQDPSADAKKNVQKWLVDCRLQDLERDKQHAQKASIL